MRDYGAVGDGSTPDTAAINSAIAAALSVNGCVYFPTGQYVYATAMAKTITGQISFRGDGWQNSQILFTGTGNGMDFDLSGGAYAHLNSVQISNLALFAVAPGSGSGAASGTAINLSYGTASGSGAETNPGSLIEDVYIGTVLTGSYAQKYALAGWTNGINANVCHNLHIDNVFLYGGSGNAFPVTSGIGSGSGINLSSCINSSIRDVGLNGWNEGITFRNAGNSLPDCQGSFMEAIRAVGCGRLIHAYGMGSMGAFTLTDWMLDNGYGGGTYLEGIYIDTCPNFTIEAGWMSLANGGPGIKINASNTILANGNFVYVGNGGTSILITGNSTDCTFTENRIQGQTIGVQIDSGCARNTVSLNNFHGAGTPVLDNGTATINVNNQT